jgi:ABC-type lipoprotein release transport system permease subunit
LVPRRLRADWRQEWKAELHYRETLLVEWDRLDWRSKLDLLWHSLGKIGIRMALGAGKSAILNMIIGQGIKLVLIGVAIGLAGALGLTRFLSGLLYGVKPGDLLTLVAVPALLMAVALLASYIPARQAAKVDPMIVLKYE